MARNKEILLRQYELIVNSSLQLTSWRQTANNFYLSVNAGLLALTSFFLGDSSLLTSIIVCIIGFVISVLWHQTVSYYRQLNTAKFKVILKLEKQLPVRLFAEENKHFKQKMRNEITLIESWIPALFAIAYLIILFIKILPTLTLVFSKFLG
jgi:hypothetical protein